ncbi:MAG: superoxide dismutase [Armatimonadota bacterium]
MKTAPKGISEATHRAHLILWQGYANKTNEIRTALASFDYDASKANQIYSQIRALRVNYAFALGGFLNHNVYFDTIGGEGGNPTGDLAMEINAAFGSYEELKKNLKATAIGARGWAYLAWNEDEGFLEVLIGDSQDTFPAWNHELILALDVYEHAYYLDFQTARAKYVDAYFEVIDWSAANARLAKAKAKGR